MKWVIFIWSGYQNWPPPYDRILTLDPIEYIWENRSILYFVIIGTNDEAMLRQALTMSLGQEEEAPTTPNVPNFSSLTEEEQIAYAMQLSLQNSGDD